MTIFNDKLTKCKNFFNHRLGDIVLTILFFISSILTIWAINIYRLTIISTIYLFATVAFGALVSYVLLTLMIKSNYSKVWTFLIKIAIGAGIFYFGLLFLNQKFADKEVLTGNFKIIRTGTLGRGRSSSCFLPYAIINFKGTEKQLVFYCDVEKAIQKFSSVTVTYSKGLFGFDIIKSKVLSG